MCEKYVKKRKRKTGNLEKGHNTIAMMTASLVYFEDLHSEVHLFHTPIFWILELLWVVKQNYIFFLSGCVYVCVVMMMCSCSPRAQDQASVVHPHSIERVEFTHDSLRWC